MVRQARHNFSKKRQASLFLRFIKCRLYTPLRNRSFSLRDGVSSGVNESPNEQPSLSKHRSMNNFQRTKGRFLISQVIRTNTSSTWPEVIYFGGRGNPRFERPCLSKPCTDGRNVDITDDPPTPIEPHGPLNASPNLCARKRPIFIRERRIHPTSIYDVPHHSYPRFFLLRFNTSIKKNFNGRR